MMAMEVLPAELLSPSEDDGGYQRWRMMVAVVQKELAEDASPFKFYQQEARTDGFKKKWLWRYKFGIHSRLELAMLQNGVLRSIVFVCRAQQSLANVVVSLWQPLVSLRVFMLKGLE